MALVHTLITELKLKKYGLGSKGSWVKVRMIVGGGKEGSWRGAKKDHRCRREGL